MKNSTLNLMERYHDQPIKSTPRTAANNKFGLHENPHEHTLTMSYSALQSRSKAMKDQTGQHCGHPSAKCEHEQNPPF